MPTTPAEGHCDHCPTDCNESKPAVSCFNQIIPPINDLSGVLAQQTWILWLHTVFRSIQKIAHRVTMDTVSLTKQVAQNDEIWTFIIACIHFEIIKNFEH